MNFYLWSNIWELDWGLSWWTVVWWGGVLVALMHIPAVLLARGGKPMAALAWILCLIALPVLGVLLWWMMGRRHMERRKRRWEHSQAEMVQSLAHVRNTLIEMNETPTPQCDVSTDDTPGGDMANIARAVQITDLFSLHQEEGVFAPTRGNQVHVFPSGKKAFDAFEAAILAAKDHIHFQFYIWQNDSVGRHFRDLLAQRAREGIEVRVLFDAIGGAPVNRGFMKPLKEAGARVAAFLPLRFFECQLRINFRNHRKIIVIDAEVGFTAGLNIGEEYLEWIDQAFEFDGPAVLQLQEVFAEDWYFATGEDLGLTRYFLPAGETEAGQYALMSCHLTPSSLLLADPYYLGGETGRDIEGETGRDIGSETGKDMGRDIGNYTSAPSSGAGSTGAGSMRAGSMRGNRRMPVMAGEPFIPREPFSNANHAPEADDLPANIAPEATVRVIASGPDKPHSVIENVFFMAMTASVERIYLTTPYFVPDQAILMAITTAALRGVDVRILTAGRTDVWLAREAGRSHYEDLLRAGVRIFEYQERILHAKSIIIDHRWSIVGSANMDIRSFELNFEVNAIIESLKLADYLADLFDEHLEHSREILLHEFSQRPLKNRLTESTARLFSPLL